MDELITELHLCRVVLAKSEMSVLLSVRLSLCINCDQMKETSTEILIPCLVVDNPCT